MIFTYKSIAYSIVSLHYFCQQFVCKQKLLPTARLSTCIFAYKYNTNFRNGITFVYMYYCLQLYCIHALLRTNKNFRNRVTFAYIIIVYMYYCLQDDCLHTLLPIAHNLPREMRAISH